MKIPTKKLNNGFEIPTLGLGTWLMGGKGERDLTHDDSADIKAIKSAIDAGVTLIDTAEMYAAGHTEELVGHAIAQFDRSKLFLISKVLPEHFAYDNVLKAAKESLKRMQTDYMDLYLLHHPGSETPIEETMRAMDTLVEEGLIKNIGVSNFTVDRIKEAQLYTKNKIVMVQTHYNLLFREPERKGVIAYCQENDIMISAWRPLQQGILTQMSNILMQEICTKYNKTPTQIALNWLISQKNVVTISKMSSATHLSENLESLGWEMDKQDIERLSQDFPGQQDISDAVPLR